MQFDYGTALYTERQDSGFMGVQPDRYGQGSGGPALEVMLPFGLLGRPLDPDLDPSGAVVVGANVLAVSDGDEGFTLPTGDPRFAQAMPDIDKGGAGLYSTVRDGTDLRVPYLLFRGDGSFTLNVPYAGGNAHTITVDVAAGEISLTHGSGVSLSITADAIQLGGAAGKALVVDDGLSDYLNAVSAALSALGNPPASPVPTTLTATKATAI